MLFSRSWLAEYVDLPDDPRELARRLTAAGLNTEGIEEKGDDVVFDIDVTTNRPDAMNHLGLAREVAVLYGRPLRRPDAAPSERTERSQDAASVEVEDAEGCPRYVARVVRGVRIGPSPDWLRRRLESIGLRSINNVVDVSNFVLWEMGQPLHAFDLAKLAGAKIVVRPAREGEELTTLDGVERKLSPGMLVIADAERPVGLAGVMGGADSEVTEATTDLLIESAHFDRKQVRLTARGLGMHTDASHRFERGADPEACLDAASRAALLITQVAGGTVLAGAIDQHLEGFYKPRAGRLELARLNAFAGIEVRAADVERWLAGLGFGLESVGEGVWDVTVPSWRFFDFQPRKDDGTCYEADFFEEVLRIHGLDPIPSTLPRLMGSDGPRTRRQKLRDRIREYLAAAGYAEAVHFVFQSRAQDARFPSLLPPAEPVALANPLSEAYAVLRRSLVPNLVETARFNQRRGLPAVRLFEIGSVFHQGLPDPADEPEVLGLVCGGTVGNAWQREVELDFFDLKGAVEGLAEALGVSLTARPAELRGLLSGNTAELLRDGRRIGYLGRIEEDEGYPLYVAEIALDGLTGGERSLAVEIPSRFPAIDADFTLTHALATPWTEIDRVIAGLRPADLVWYGLKVRYQGQGVPDGAVNTTISFLYNSQERSLTQDEVNERQSGLTAELERRFGWRS